MRVVRSRITRLRKEHDDGVGSLAIGVKNLQAGSTSRRTTVPVDLLEER